VSIVSIRNTPVPEQSRSFRASPGIETSRGQSRSEHLLQDITSAARNSQSNDVSFLNVRAEIPQITISTGPRWPLQHSGL